MVTAVSRIGLWATAQPPNRLRLQGQACFWLFPKFIGHFSFRSNFLNTYSFVNFGIMNKYFFFTELTLLKQLLLVCLQEG
jgi:hypothetical protein